MELISWTYKNSPRHDMCGCLLLHYSAASASFPFISIIPYIHFTSFPSHPIVSVG
jgi:hypothetical protein